MNAQASAPEKFVDILRQNHAGRPVGVTSICSANRYVLEAAMRQAHSNECVLLIESTSNQVNQFGGYTGETPVQFVKFVHDLASRTKFPIDRLLLGGDHLGPHVWSNEPAASAMEKGCVLVREYVRAGYSKIHLDTSMRCADDAAGKPLSDEVISARAAVLCEAAERVWRELPKTAPAPVYVVGTEVPVPGGTHADETAVPQITRTDDLGRTLDLSKAAFCSRALDDAWERVIAVVVQPGVEFGDSRVFTYDPRKTRELSGFLEKHWTGVYEAHSTDYQTAAALRQMVDDHFAILKVGPWLTFAFREAIFALETMEQEWLSSRAGVGLSGVRDALEAGMLENAAHWKAHYQGDSTALHFARKYSYSDRSRYYWAEERVSAAVEQLIANLTRHPVPASLLSQYLPVQYEQMKTGQLENRPLDLIRSKITQVLDQYAFACGGGQSRSSAVDSGGRLC